MDKYLTRSVSNSSLNSKRDREEDEPEDWQLPKRPATPRRDSVNKPIFTTSNRYSNLAVDNQLPEPLRAAVSTRKNTSRIPPIIIQLQENWNHNKILKLIEKHSKEFHLQYRSKNKVAVHCYTTASHQSVKEGLVGEDIQFHTFTRKDEKMYKVVIRGLPAYFEDTLAEELGKIGFKDVAVTKLSSPTRQDSPCPPFLVRLPVGSDISKFRQVKYIGNTVVDIRRFKPGPSAGTQCYRCQNFGHASRNCNLPTRCVKCAEPHATKECPKKDRSSPARCCNCLEEHPANYSKCVERQKYLDRLKKRSEVRGAVQVSTSNTLPSLIHQGPTNWSQPQLKSTITPVKYKNWASVVAEREKQVEPPVKSLDYDDTTKEMLQILTVIKTIKGQFVECKTMLDKVTLILSHLGQYF